MIYIETMCAGCDYLSSTVSYKMIRSACLKIRFSQFFWPIGYELFHAVSGYATWPRISPWVKAGRIKCWI